MEKSRAHDDVLVVDRHADGDDGILVREDLADEFASLGGRLHGLFEGRHGFVEIPDDARTLHDEIAAFGHEPEILRRIARLIHHMSAKSVAHDIVVDIADLRQLLKSIAELLRDEPRVTHEFVLVIAHDILTKERRKENEHDRAEENEDERKISRQARRDLSLHP